MENLWSDHEAGACVRRYAQQGISEDLALRVYTTRLLGAEPRLVLHGGGNTSVKTRLPDITGETVEVLCVKGSGWDMASIEPQGLPAVRLEPLRQLAAMEALSDTDMVNVQRRNLLDATAPNPSVETLLHAFLPHKFVDHTHANAVLALTDQPDGAAICHGLYDGRAALVPYIMPGFALAKTCAEIHEQYPGVEGLILLKHGIFSFGESAEEAYARMIALVSAAEARLVRGPRRPITSRTLPVCLASAARVAPILRGLASSAEATKDESNTRFILNFRSSSDILAYVNGVELDRYSQAGVVTPDHAIRTKPKPLLLPAPDAGRLDEFATAARAAMADFEAEYHAYFARHNAEQAEPKTELDAVPRVLLVPGLGMFGLGGSAKAAGVAADIAATAIEVVGNAEAIGRFESISESEVFDVEYWSLEQAKLGMVMEKSLARHVVLVTGGAGGIGAATAGAFAAEGAEVAIVDRDGRSAVEVATKLGGLGVTCDVTDQAAVSAAFDRVCEAYGGIDIVVSNAGAVWQGAIGEVSEAELRESFELNFFAHQTVAQNAVRVMRAQGFGGLLLFNTSKQAVNPGPAIGPYGIAKAATLSLMRQYAIDYGKEGIRSNAVNADRIRSGLLTDGMIESRAKARGVSEAAYMSGNLLGREVTVEDVARAFVSLALARKTTGAVLTVDGGNIAAALR